MKKIKYFRDIDVYMLYITVNFQLDDTKRAK